MRPFTTGGGYLNFMMGDEGDARIKATYGSNLDRLQTVKRKYDRHNLFSVNHNIAGFDQMIYEAVEEKALVLEPRVEAIEDGSTDLHQGLVDEASLSDAAV